MHRVRLVRLDRIGRQLNTFKKIRFANFAERSSKGRASLLCRETGAEKPGTFTLNSFIVKNIHNIIINL